jgi:hypothetical protein
MVADLKAICLLHEVPKTAKPEIGNNAPRKSLSIEDVVSSGLEHLRTEEWY